MRRVLASIGTLLLAIGALGVGVLGGFALDTYVPGPKDLDEMLNRGGEAQMQTNIISADGDQTPLAFYQTKDDASVRICRIVNVETLEAECGPWSDD